MPRTEITRDDLMDLADYSPIRKQKRQELSIIKKNRRVEIGPVATAYFESYDTMWWQVQEMLYIEKGGEEQIADELAAYNPLIPKGRELVTTVMFEIDDEIRRRNFLSRLGGVEETMFIEFLGETVTGVPEKDLDRTSTDGKASSVQFIHFPFSDEQAKAFRNTNKQVMVGFRNPEYSHMCVIQDAVREALAADFA
ncbi:MAG: hypothetical protein CMM76_02220 [Rhodospirillaceae bacterium]|nr:hypothetical protein [Rhodospirillaceae bacterium]